MRWDRFKPRRAARPVVFLWACAVILLGLGTTSAQTPQMKVNELRLPCSVTWGNVRFAINESGDVANLREAEKPLMSLITLHVHAKGWRGIRDFRPGQVHFADQAWGREVKVQGTLVHEGREFPCVKTLSLRHEGAVGFTYEVRPHSDVELEPIYGMLVLPMSAYRGETARMDGMDVVYPAEPEKSVFHEDRMNARHVVLGAKAAEHRLSLISHTGWAQLIDQRVKPWNAQNYSLHFWGHRWVSFTLHFREVPPQDVPVQSALLPLGAKIPCDFSDGLWACTVDKNGDLKNLLLRQQTLLVGSRFGLHAKGWKSPDRVHYDAPVMRPADFGVEVHASGKMTFGAVEVPFQRILRIHREGKIEFEATLDAPEGFSREQAYMQLDLPLDEYRGESALVDGQEVTYPHEPRQDYPRSGAFWTGKARELRLGKAKKHSLNLSFPTPTTVNLIDHRVPLWGNSKTYDVHVWENESGRIRFALALPSGVRRNELREFMGVPERRPRWELPKPLEGCERVKHVDLGAGATEGFASDDALVSLDGGWWRPMAAATAKARFADLSPDRSYVVRFRMARARGGVDYLDMCRISPSGVVMANGKYIGSYGSASWTSPPESYRYQLPAEIVAADGSLEISFHQPDLIRARNSLFPWVAIEEGKLPEPPRFSPKPLTS
ncbi:MAG: hypothetical protein FJ279_18680, partial [Planctomycetes bacterium]|nr:hypothetical protein [Planctomycetota bacterium]